MELNMYKHELGGKGLKVFSVQHKSAEKMKDVKRLITAAPDITTRELIGMDVEKSYSCLNSSLINFKKKLMDTEKLKQLLSKNITLRSAARTEDEINEIYNIINICDSRLFIVYWELLDELYSEKNPEYIPHEIYEANVAAFQKIRKSFIKTEEKDLSSKIGKSKKELLKTKGRYNTTNI